MSLMEINETTFSSDARCEWRSIAKDNKRNAQIKM